MKNRKEIIQDIDKIWREHLDNVINKEKKQRPIGNKIASYILKIPCCGHACCCGKVER